MIGKVKPGDVVTYKPREWMGPAVVIGYNDEIERWAVKFTKRNKYTHSCDNAVGGYRGLWVKGDELEVIGYVGVET